MQQKREEIIMSTLRLVTQNQWSTGDNTPEWEKLGKDCSAKARMPGHLQVIKDIMPDILGGQEVDRRMQSYLMNLITDERLPYTLIWGLFVPIIYRRDKLELLDQEYLMYPLDMEGYDGPFNNARTKACNLAVFREKASGKVFIYATTHLWWQSDDMTPGSRLARAYQARLATEMMEKYSKQYQNCPMVFCGDLNDVYDSPCVKAMEEAGFVHGYHAATEFRFEGMGYNNNNYSLPPKWIDAPFEKAIDHVFVKGFKKDAVKRFDRYCPDYYLYLSDHAPCYIDIEI